MIGIGGMILLSSFNYQYFRSLLVSSYVVSLVLLISVLVVGRSIRGTGRWINFHFFAFQPIEITKIIFILVLSGYLDSVWKEVKRVTTLGVALAILFGHIVLILLQPDFGSSLVYFPITIVLLFVAGVSPAYLAGVTLFGGLAAGIPLMATFFKLQPDLLSASPALAYFVSASRGGSAPC